TRQAPHSAAPGPCVSNGRGEGLPFHSRRRRRGGAATPPTNQDVDMAGVEMAVDGVSPRGAGAEDGTAVTGVEETLAAVVAERVRELRLRHGWTVGRLADECGLSKSMLSKIENAQSSPSLGTLARLAEALSVPVTAFFRGLSEEQDVIH